MNTLIEGFLEIQEGKNKEIMRLIEEKTKSLERQIKTDINNLMGMKKGIATKEQQIILDEKTKIEPKHKEKSKSEPKSMGSTAHQLATLQEKVMKNIIHLSDVSNSPASDTQRELSYRDILKSQASNHEGETSQNITEFVEVKSRKSKRKQHKVGTAEITMENDSFGGSATARTKKIWIFLKKVNDNTSVDNIKKFICLKTSMAVDDVYVRKVETFYRKKDNNCYIIGVEPTLQEEVYNERFWPTGVVFERFNFMRGEKFLEKNREHKNNTTTSVQQQVENF